MTNTKKEPALADAEACIAIRKRGRRGEHLSRDDLKLCEKMLRQYPEWYSKTQTRVLNETIPFGSDVHFD